MSQAVRFRDMWSVPGSSVLALAVAVAAACVPSVSHSAADEVLYGVTYDGKLITIDLATGAGTLVGSSTLSGCEAMEEANDSTLAVIDGANTFWLVKRSNGAISGGLAPFPLPYSNVNSLALVGGDLFAAAQKADLTADMLKINPVTGAWGVVWPITGTFPEGLAPSPDPNLLYGVQSCLSPSPTIFQVDKTSGSTSGAHALGGFVTTIDLSANGQLYGVGSSDCVSEPSDLVRIDPASGAVTRIGSIGVGGGGVWGLAFMPQATTGVPDPPRPGAARILPLQNPARRGVRLRCTVPAGPCTVRVYSAAGQLVSTLLEGSLTPGEHLVSWDGNNSQEAPAPAGVYFVRMDTGKGHDVAKLLFLR